jgi:Protein of unknown function (DUF1460)
MNALAAALLVAAAQPQLAQLSEAKLDRKIAAVHAAPAIGDRIAALSKLMLGTPYADYPLGEGGEGPEPQARFRLDAVDCQTFVETVLALANARDLAEAKILLDDIRYAKAPPSFSTRSHFTEAQWLPANIGKGYLREEARSVDRNAPVAELVLSRAEWSKVPALQRLLAADIPEGRFDIPYLPLAEMKESARRIPAGSVILVVREADPNRVVRVSHMGFVLRGPGGVFVRHASPTDALGHQVVDEPFDAYLTRMSSFKKWPVQGFGLALPLDAKGRAAQVLRASQQASKTP